MVSVPDLGISSKEQEVAGGVGQVGKHSREDVLKIAVIQRSALLDTMIEGMREIHEREAYPVPITPETSRTLACRAPPE